MGVKHYIIAGSISNVVATGNRDVTCWVRTDIRKQMDVVVFYPEENGAIPTFC